jgi:crossover junction endodeoxyribonuclease RuvC
MKAILGIDPSLAQCGWGIIVQDKENRIRYLASGTIKTSSSELLYLRLATIAKTIDDVIKSNNIYAVAMEETFMNTNASSSMKLAAVRGALMSVVGLYRLPFFEYKPNTIKKSVVGVGHAQKDQIISMIQKIVSNIPKDYKLSTDEADALAVAYTCIAYNGHRI